MMLAHRVFDDLQRLRVGGEGEQIGNQEVPEREIEPVVVQRRRDGNVPEEGEGEREHPGPLGEGAVSQTARRGVHDEEGEEAGAEEVQCGQECGNLTISVNDCSHSNRLYREEVHLQNAPGDLEQHGLNEREHEEQVRVTPVMRRFLSLNRSFRQYQQSDGAQVRQHGVLLLREKPGAEEQRHD